MGAGSRAGMRKNSAPATRHKEKHMSNVYWPLYEVFVRSKQGLSHRHVGSLHAADDRWRWKMPAMLHPSQRRLLLWVVKASEIVASQPEERGEFFDPAESKVYRHPTSTPCLMAWNICEAAMKTESRCNLCPASGRQRSGAGPAS
jgi:ring-1,2-phenylacetyl-CoA epoxidase subunit PaaB